MVALPHRFTAFASSIALPAGLLLAGLALIGHQLDLPAQLWPAAAIAGPATVTIAPTDFTYRLDGSFWRHGDLVDAPVVTTRLNQPLTIMQYQVSAADYANCVAESACEAAAPVNIGEGDIPVTGVNFGDATSYATWLSKRTGQNWTLPTDEEWAYAAGERLVDEGLNVDDSANPALRWLANYEAETRRDSTKGRIPLPLGSFGSNGLGVADIAGNVWEWTQTCHRRVHIDDAGTFLSEAPACTIRLLAGEHRAPMSYFVRDAKSGGCSVGVPPANIGFRLVQHPNWRQRLMQAFAA